MNSIFKPTQKRLYDQKIISCLYKGEEFISNGIFAIRKDLAKIDPKYQLVLQGWEENNETRLKLDSVVGELNRYDYPITDTYMVNVQWSPIALFKSVILNGDIELDPYYMHYLTGCMDKIDYELKTNEAQDTIVFISNGELLAVIKPIKDNE